MYSIGAKVVHPFYGPGTIVDVRGDNVDGTGQRYYVIETLARSNILRFMVEVDGAEERGLRLASDMRRLRSVLIDAVIASAERPIEKRFVLRQRRIRQWLVSGSLEQVAAAYADLLRLRTRRRMGVNDRRLLQEAKDRLAGEWALTADCSLTRATGQLERVVQESLLGDQG